MNEPQEELTFGRLVTSIRQIHDQMAAQAGKAVNVSLTLRNWAIGFYILEYEQNGADRAKYGRQLLERLANRLQQSIDKCYTGRYLRLCRQFYETYPQIRKSLISKSALPEKGKSPISKLHHKLGADESQTIKPPSLWAISENTVIEETRIHPLHRADKA